jgi:two-component system sensor histidine kinase BaeS
LRKRIAFTIVGVVAGALLVAGLGTVLLARQATRRDVQHDLEEQAMAIAQAAEDARRPAAITALRRALELENIALARRSPRGWVDLPPEIDADDLAPLDTRSTVRGSHGSLAYAAAVINAPRARTAVVLTREIPGTGAFGYFLVAASAALLVAALVGDRLGRRIARPLEDAVAATGQIASGDFDARVQTGPSTDAELASLTASINAMAENLAHLRDIERQFLLSVSHDLRTPLTSIRGFAEAIADGATDDTVRAAGVIASEARRLERLVADLLDLARLDAREFKLDAQTVDVGTVVTDTADGFQPAAREAGIELSVAVEADDTTAVVDPVRLAQVVANLLENALSFATHRVDVAVEHGAGRLIIAVTDDGPGIPPGEHERVFERLYQPARGPDVRPRPLGSGLGLAIVAELVAAMGGTVAARPAPGGGTRVFVTIDAS